MRNPSHQYIQGFVEHSKSALSKPSATVSLLTPFPEISIQRLPLPEIGRIIRGVEDVSCIVTPAITQPHQTVTPSLDYTYVRDRLTGLICSTMQVHYEVGYSAIFIRLAAELTEGGVGYNAVLQHETERVGIYRQDMAAMRDRVATALEHVIAGQYLVSTTLDEAVAKHTAIANSLAQTTIAPAMNEIEVALRNHDNSQAVATINAKLVESGELRQPLLHMLSEMGRVKVDDK
ncbi:MAG: hypothetical protein ACN6O8_09710 [Achromobacter sp.]|uniref:hypothetical protein n=1 Tax=Achromobacter sp. TaxID=134375 RepID=UPI003D051E2D